jgi:hypothetical protein
MMAVKRGKGVPRTNENDVRQYQDLAAIYVAFELSPRVYS